MTIDHETAKKLAAMIIEAFSHVSLCHDYIEKHGGDGQADLITWETSYPNLIRAILREATFAPLRDEVPE